MGILKKETELLDNKTVDNIRALGIDMINNANSGHPGIVLGAAPILYTLYAYHMKIDPKDDKWINRDRFVISNGHGSALLYSTLFMSGYNISLDDLKDFRKINSITPGHPEYNVTPGVDISTGALGQGIANAVGMAISERYLQEFFGKEIIDYNTYVLCGDGDLMEGISYEAMSLAGKLCLNKLIVLYDSNGISLDGDLDESFNENIAKRMEAMGWDIFVVNDSEDVNAINEAISKAKASDKPSLIEVKTVIGKYSINQGTNKVHGGALSTEDVSRIKQKLSLRDIPFSVSDEAINAMQEQIKERNKQIKEEWEEKLLNINEDMKQYISNLENIKTPVKLKELYYDFNEEQQEATRYSSGKIINSIASVFPLFMGGSADVAISTFASILEGESIQNTFLDRNIHFGAREHAMGAIANGMATCGLTPFVSTFLSFSDYLKPAIRMSAMMNLPVIYIFTHDSISIGEDGPTHQPIEQLVSLRSIPNLDVYRPADVNETLGVYKNILETRKPSAVILGRNKVDILESTSVNETKNGAYIIQKEEKNLNAVIIATGEELHLALEVTKKLTEKGIGIRLVSMPSIECFLRQPEEYKESILPEGIKCFVIEASSSYSWHQFTKRQYLFTIDEFGKSGNKEDVMNKYGFNAKDIELKIEELLK